VYGCFEKQGCLRSKKDKKIMINEDPCWNRPQRFMERMLLSFDENRCDYGKVLFHEMYGHRLGDKAIMKNDSSYLDSMLYQYVLAQDIGERIKSYKHTFTPFYWAACYFYEMNDKVRCVTYYKKGLNKMNKYCPDARPGYREKVLTSLRNLKKIMNKKEWNKYRKRYSTYTNRCLKKVKAP